MVIYYFPNASVLYVVIIYVDLQRYHGQIPGKILLCLEKVKTKEFHLLLSLIDTLHLIAFSVDGIVKRKEPCPPNHMVHLLVKPWF